MIRNTHPLTNAETAELWLIRTDGALPSRVDAGPPLTDIGQTVKFAISAIAISVNSLHRMQRECVRQGRTVRPDASFGLHFQERKFKDGFNSYGVTPDIKLQHIAWR